MYTSPNLRSVVANSSPACDAGLPTSCLLDELEDVILLLLLAAVDRPHVGRPLLVELRRLPRHARDAHHPACGQLVTERRRQRRALPHDERLDLLGDAHGVGPRRHLVRGAAGGGERDQLDLSPVRLVVRLVEADDVLHRLDLLLDRVVGVDGVGDVVDDRVLLLGQVVDDLDRVTGHAGRRRPTVVTLERRVALGSEVVRDRDRAALGVAALVPLDLDALLLGVGEAQWIRDLTAARCRTRAGCARAGPGRRAVRRRGGRVRRRCVGRRCRRLRGRCRAASSSSSSPPLVAMSTPATMATTATIAAIGPHRRHARPPPDDCSPALAGCMCIYPLLDCSAHLRSPRCSGPLDGGTRRAEV